MTAKPLTLALALIASAALAEVVLNNQGTRAGPVTTLNCSGSGITCTRNGSTGTLSVSGADGGGSALVQGCPAGQYFNALDAGIGYCSVPVGALSPTGCSAGDIVLSDGGVAYCARPAESWVTVVVADAGTGAPLFEHSWIPYDATAYPVRYYRDALGIVHPMGIAKSGSVGQIIFRFPPGYRPSKTVEFAIEANSGFGQARVDSDGGLWFDTGSTTAVTLANITFRAEQ